MKLFKIFARTTKKKVNISEYQVSLNKLGREQFERLLKKRLRFPIAVRA